MTSTLQYPLSDETRAFLGRPSFGHLIGEKVQSSVSGATMYVEDPATGDEFAEVAAGGPEDVDLAVTEARSAFDDGRWRKLAPPEKERCLRRLAQLLADNAGLLAELDVLDNGMPKLFADYTMAMSEEIAGYYAGWPSKLDGVVHPSGEDLMVYTTREPIGVCAAIVPWNGPAAAAVWKIVPAVACGNSIVLKPAEQTPMSAIVLGELCLEAGIPPGVVNVVHGAGETVGKALVDHPGVDKIAFTGSTETGRLIGAAAASTLKRVTLELGGKGANVVFADADLHAAAIAAAATAWGNSGQACLAGTRLLVERSVHDELLGMVIELTRNMKLGSGFDPTVTMGPLVSRVQFERVSGYIALGQQEGASLAYAGDRPDGPGWFVSPTIFTDVRNDMRIAQEEIFGPVLSVIPFDTEEQAYAIANDTQFGLAGAVWTSDVGRAHRAGRAIRSGVVWINSYGELLTNVPYGGMKQSGYGRELGQGSLDIFTETKSVYLRLAPAQMPG
jgi:aldehyde dehydrogenase (NAD+)